MCKDNGFGSFPPLKCGTTRRVGRPDGQSDTLNEPKWTAWANDIEMIDGRIRSIFDLGQHQLLLLQVDQHHRMRLLGPQFRNLKVLRDSSVGVHYRCSIVFERRWSNPETFRQLRFVAQIRISNEANYDDSLQYVVYRPVGRAWSSRAGRQQQTFLGW
jgi:hypothetical protein